MDSPGFIFPAPTNSLQLSIVCPVYNEQDNLNPLIAEILQVLKTLAYTFEIVLVDDGSRDKSWDVIQQLSVSDARIRGIKLKSQCGETAAIWVGLVSAMGEKIITLASDRQNDPADIPVFLDALKDNVDVVCGVRRNRQEGFIRKLSSQIANRIRRKLLSSSLSDSGCGFRAVRRACLYRLPWHRGMHRFLGDILSFQGFNVKEISVGDRPRIVGKTKYGLWNRLAVVWLDVLAVAWMKRRRIQPVIENQIPLQK